MRMLTRTAPAVILAMLFPLLAPVVAHASRATAPPRPPTSRRSPTRRRRPAARRRRLRSVPSTAVPRWVMPTPWVARTLAHGISVPVRSRTSSHSTNSRHLHTHQLREHADHPPTQYVESGGASAEFRLPGVARRLPATPLAGHASRVTSIRWTWAASQHCIVRRAFRRPRDQGLRHLPRVSLIRSGPSTRTQAAAHRTGRPLLPRPTT